MNNFITTLILLLCLSTSAFGDVTLGDGKNLNVSVSASEAQVVHTAFDILKGDFHRVFGKDLVKGATADLRISTLGIDAGMLKGVDEKQLAQLRAHAEGFLIEVKGNQLLVIGSDPRGTAYGILEISRMIGVSPWEWWADAVVEKKKLLKLEDGFTRLQYPSVKNRGIFLNDEDFALLPWSSQHFEPGLVRVAKTKGAIGPKTYGKIFELLLRLRANTIWPAMHEVTTPFYFSKGNREMADQYGIIVGTSHCEPLMRNSVNEWDIDGKGPYDYTVNKKGILDYWTERLKELKGSENVYTIGLRGKHDGMMQGVKTLKEHQKVLQQVIYDQRKLLATYTNPVLNQIPQIFVPYKEVLDVYENGLDVPDDITLIWCDDNYGYIKHFPTEKEAARSGGNGVYYHISYWGRPHDYLWLASTHPAQIFTQMKLAYDKGAKDFWILNVGDIKPGEYLTELFLDMAWDIGAIENSKKGLDDHLKSWLSREFGKQKAEALLPIMREYYRLAYVCKPELMGGTRTEEKDPAFKVVTDLPWSEKEIRERIRIYGEIAHQVQHLGFDIPPAKRDAWFELIEYPVCGAAELNKKLLYGQLARHDKAPWALSDRSHENIIALTQQYNQLGGGKWKGMMNERPRELAVFQALPHQTLATPFLTRKEPIKVFNGNQYSSFGGATPLQHGLGYEGGAVSLAKGASINFTMADVQTDSLTIEVALAPNHPVDGKDIRYSIQVGSGPVQKISFKTEGRSEEWKGNVLTNQAKRTTRHKLTSKGKQIITITALDEGVVVDQVKVL